MTTNETTTHLNLPLPVATNDLSVDVDKLRQTIQALDLHLYNYLTTLSGKADSGHNHAIADVLTLQTTLDDLSSRTAPDVLDDLSDVDAASPVTGQFLKWQGSVYVSAKITLDDVENLVTGLNQKLNASDFNTSFDTRLENWVGAAPAALDTLAELGASLNNDPDFAATMTTALAGKAAVGHLHDERYYQKSEVDAALGGKQAYNAQTAIKDESGVWLKGQVANAVTLTDGATITPNLLNGNAFKLTIAGNRTLAAPTNQPASDNEQDICIRVTQDATGSRTLAFNSYWKFAEGEVPALSTASGAEDLLVGKCFAGYGILSIVKGVA